MRNEAAAAAMITRVTGLAVELHTLSGNMTLNEQAEFFRAYGLIIAPHSSQLVGMLFAQVLPPPRHHKRLSIGLFFVEWRRRSGLRKNRCTHADSAASMSPPDATTCI